MNGGTGSLMRVCTLLVCLLAATACTRGLLSPPYGLQEGRLGHCEGLRGCVSSQADDPAHYIEPLHYRDNRYDARDDLVAVLRTFNNAKVVSSHRSYMRVEFPSMAAQDGDDEVAIGSSTIDDTEFFFPVDERVIHVRSMPRRNMPDAGENRSRIEVIRERLAARQERRLRD